MCFVNTSAFVSPRQAEEVGLSPWTRRRGVERGWAPSPHCALAQNRPKDVEQDWTRRRGVVLERRPARRRPRLNYYASDKFRATAGRAGGAADRRTLAKGGRLLKPPAVHALRAPVPASVLRTVVPALAASGLDGRSSSIAQPAEEPRVRRGSEDDGVAVSWNRRNPAPLRVRHGSNERAQALAHDRLVHHARQS